MSDITKALGLDKLVKSIEDLSGHLQQLQEALISPGAITANPTPAAATPVAQTVVPPATTAVTIPTGYPTADPTSAVPFTTPAQTTAAPATPAAAPSASTSTPSQAYPSNPTQPTYPPQIQQPAPAPQQPPVTTGITYTVEQIADAAAPIMQRGDGQKLIELLSKYGVQALTQLDAQYLPSFAADIRALGARI